MKTNMSKRTKWITRTAVLTALLVVMQFAASLSGNQIVTGSVVNMMLILSVMTGSLSTGLTVAAISPVMAKLIGIGPLWGLIPFIIAGNMALVLIWHLIGKRKTGNIYIARIIALITAAIVKFLVLYTGVVLVAVPYLLRLPEKQAAVISTMFSFTQILTASIGGIVAILALTAIDRAVKRE